MKLNIPDFVFSDSPVIGGDFRQEFNLQPIRQNNDLSGGNLGDAGRDQRNRPLIDLRTRTDDEKVPAAVAEHTNNIDLVIQPPLGAPETHYPTIDELLGPPASDPAGVIELEMDGRHDYFVVGELEFERELPPRLPYQHEQSLPLPLTRLPGDPIEFDGAVGFSRRVSLGEGVSVLVTSNEDTSAGGATFRFNHPTGHTDIRFSQRPGAPGTDQTITHRTEENLLGVVFDRTTTLRNNSGQPISISSESGATIKLTDDISVVIRRNDTGFISARLDYRFGDVRGNINYNFANDSTGIQIQTENFRLRVDGIFDNPPSVGINGIIRF